MGRYLFPLVPLWFNERCLYVVMGKKNLPLQHSAVHEWATRHVPSYFFLCILFKGVDGEERESKTPCKQNKLGYMSGRLVYVLHRRKKKKADEQREEVGEGKRRERERGGVELDLGWAGL